MPQKTEKSQENVVDNLKVILADTYVLYVKTQNFHWNITGPQFRELHLFFEGLYKELANAVDDIAERIRMLHRRAPGTMQTFLKLTSIKESEEALSEDEMLSQLFADHEKMIKSLKSRIQICQNDGDEGTADLLIQRLRAHEKAAWMLRSHLENPEHR